MERLSRQALKAIKRGKQKARWGCCKPAIPEYQDVEAGRLGVQGQLLPPLQGECEANPGYSKQREMRSESECASVWKQVAGGVISQGLQKPPEARRLFRSLQAEPDLLTP